MVAQETTMPILAKRANELGVTTLDGEEITTTEVVFGEVTGKRWTYRPSQVTHYTLKVPGGYISITVSNSDPETIDLLQANLATLRIESP